MLKAEIEPGQHQPQILHDGAGLLLDTFGQLARRIGRIRHLSGDKDETIGFDGMAEWRDRLWPACDHVKFH
jgi:hypothetical protein